MIAADLSAKPGILIASGGEAGKAEELLPVVQSPLSNTGGMCPGTAAFGLQIAGGDEVLPEQGRDRWASGSCAGM